MGDVFPSLSSDGFIENRSILSKKLFDMFIASDMSQSNFKDCQSLKYILNSETVDEYSKKDDIKKALETLYSAYFDSSIATVTSITTEDNVIVYKMKVDCVYNGVTYSTGGSISKDYYLDIDKFDKEYLEVIN